MIIINDIHLFSSHALYSVENFEEILNFYRKMRNEIVLAGDIVDLSNVKKNEVDDAIKYAQKLKYDFGPRYLCGNHELQTFDSEIYKIPNEPILIAHGHRELWGQEKCEEYYKNSSIGAGFLKRSILPAFDYFRHFKNPKINNEQENRINYLLQKYSCKTLICGHSHIKKKIQIGNVILLPRGVNVI